MVIYNLWILSNLKCHILEKIFKAMIIMSDYTIYLSHFKEPNEGVRYYISLLTYYALRMKFKNSPEITISRILNYVIQCLKFPEIYTKKNFLEVSSKVTDKDTGESIISYLKDGDPVVRAISIHGLGDSLISYLKNNVPVVKAISIRDLGESTTNKAVDLLINCLKDDNVLVRAEAARTLGILGDTRAVKPLIICLRDNDKNVRANAAEALGKIGDSRAVKPLTNLLSDSNENVRKAAEKSLRLIK